MSYELPTPPSQIRQLARAGMVFAAGMALGWFLFVGIPKWWGAIGKPLLCVAMVAALTACGGGDPEDQADANTQPVNCAANPGACK